MFAPVEVAEEPPVVADAGEEARPARRRKATRTSGTIEIELKSGDPERLKAALMPTSWRALLRP